MVSPNEAVVQTVGLTKVFRDFWHAGEGHGRQRAWTWTIQPSEVFGLLGAQRLRQEHDASR